MKSRAARIANFIGLVAAVAASFALGSAPRPAMALSCVPSAGIVTGRLVVLDGTNATFVVESAQPGSRDAPPPSAGSRITIRYGGDAQFLRVGTRYRAQLLSLGNGFGSYVHSSECTSGTVYADGSRIDTSLWARSSVRRIAMVFVALFAAGLVAVVLTLRRRRPVTPTWP
jgi:hypothetical protein